MVNIAVTGLNAVDNPAPGVAVVRSLREQGIQGKIIGLAYDALEPGILTEDIVDAAYLMPYPNAGTAPLLERILEIHAKQNLGAIMPCLDSELMNFIQIEPDLTSHGIKLFLPEMATLKGFSKACLQEKLAEAEIKTPETKVVDNLYSIKGHLQKMGLPVFVKGVFYEAYKANTVAEAEEYSRTIAAQWGYPIILQKYIDGEELNVAVLADGSKDICLPFCMKKLVLTGKGKGWTCISIENSKLIAIAETITHHFQWRGPMEIEAIQSKEDGEIYIIEINPRLPAWIYLTKAAGLNLPYLYLQMILGEEVNLDRTYKKGVVFSNFTTNIITNIETIESLFTAGEIDYAKTL